MLMFIALYFLLRFKTQNYLREQKKKNILPSFWALRGQPVTITGHGRMPKAQNKAAKALH